jgi:hypothetical protein
MLEDKIVEDKVLEGKVLEEEELIDSPVPRSIDSLVDATAPAVVNERLSSPVSITVGSSAIEERVASASVEEEIPARNSE